MRTLGCSEFGDKRFSDKYAEVTFFGIVDTIHNHFNSCIKTVKMNEDILTDEKKYLTINGSELEYSYADLLYKTLWVLYLEENRELCSHINSFNSFTNRNKKSEYDCDEIDVTYVLKKYKHDASKKELLNDVFNFCKFISVKHNPKRYLIYSRDFDCVKLLGDVVGLSNALRYNSLGYDYMELDTAANTYERVKDINARTNFNKLDLKYL